VAYSRPGHADRRKVRIGRKPAEQGPPRDPYELRGPGNGGGPSERTADKLAPSTDGRIVVSHGVFCCNREARKGDTRGARGRSL
jgi:hypothetical protein